MFQDPRNIFQNDLSMFGAVPNVPVQYAKLNFILSSITFTSSLIYRIRRNNRTCLNKRTPLPMRKVKKKKKKKKKSFFAKFNPRVSVRVKFNPNPMVRFVFFLKG